MITGPIAGDRIRALAGEVCRVSPCWWPGTEGVRAAGASGLAGVAARGPGLAEHGVPVVFDDEDRDRDGCDAAGRAGGHAIWTHPFSGHVPSLRQVQPPHWARRITARRLLSHRAGMPNPHNTAAPTSGPLSRSAASRPGPRPSWPACLPRQVAVRARLNGLVTQALARLCSRLQWPPSRAGRSPNWLTKEILGPLGVGATAFAYTPHPWPRAAVGYHPRLSPMRLLLLPHWVIGEPAGRWKAAPREATVPR